MNWPLSYPIFKKIPPYSIFKDGESISFKHYLNHYKYTSYNGAGSFQPGIFRSKNYQNSKIFKATRRVFRAKGQLARAKSKLFRATGQLFMATGQLVRATSLLFRVTSLAFSVTSLLFAAKGQIFASKIKPDGLEFLHIFRKISFRNIIINL